MSAALDLGNLLAEAFAFHEAGDLDQAMALYRRVLSANPRDAQAHKGLGVALCQVGHLGRGSRMLKRACDLDPEDPECWVNLANACLASRDLAGCKAASERALELDPDNAVAHNNLAAALRGLHDLDGSFQHAQEAVRLAPDFAQAHINLGAAQQSVGAAQEAALSFKEALRLDPQQSRMSQAYLFALLYDEDTSPEECLESHRHWGASKPAPPRPRMKPEPETIGFVSGDLRQHPVGRFLYSFLAEFAQGRRVVLYSNNAQDDAVTEQFKSLPVEWRSVVGKDAGEVADMVRGDGIDVLFDVSGHSAANRLDVFALRPAPLQVTWLGYSATTGLPAMDWFLGDEFVFPPSAPGYATERLGRLETAFLVDARRETPSDHAIGDRIRIGITNNPAKLSDSFLRSVAGVLDAAPHTEAVFKYGSAGCEVVRRRIFAALESCGIHSGRICVVGALPHDEHVEFLSQLDFCLDSFPYNGATTTMDALQAGTPVLSLAGKTYASRMTGSLLHHAGIDEWIAETKEEFVDKAVAMSHDRERLEKERQRLAELLPDSPLLDAKRFSVAFDKAVRSMWDATLP